MPSVSNPHVNITSPHTSGLRPKLVTALIFVTAGVCLIAVPIQAPAGFRAFWLGANGVVRFASIAGPIILIFASVYLFVKPWSGYVLGVFAGAVTMPLLVLRESLNFFYSNPWIGLNLPDSQSSELSFCKWRILSVFTAGLALCVALLRVLPERWTFRSKAMADRTWPAFAVMFLLTGLWMAKAASPYRIPMIVDGVSSDIAILHVTKRGTHFNETSATLWRDGKFMVSRANRQWFRYRSPITVSRGLVPEQFQKLKTAVLLLPQTEASGSRPKGLRSWQAEGWYLRIGRSKICAYTSDNGLSPPPEITNFFSELENTPTAEDLSTEMKDVCLGFCYDPSAGLGILYVNERCQTKAGNVTQCE